MKITKQYIEENLINKKGYINANYHKMVNETREELYLIYNELTEVPKCSGGNDCKFKSFTKGYLNVCGDMKCQCYKDRYKRTQETLKKTNLKKYVVEYNFSLKENKEKERATKLEKYGDENYNNRDSAIKTNRENGTYEENHIKAKITSLEKYGDATYRNIEKQKQTKLEKYGDENFNNAEVAQEQKRKTMEETGRWIPEPELSNYQKYKKLVMHYTRKSNIENLENYDKIGLTGVSGAYHLDHMYSIYEGFKNCILPHFIGNILNLKIIPWRDNILKGSKCSLKIKDILYY